MTKPCIRCDSTTETGISVDIDLPMIPACGECIDLVKLLGYFAETKQMKWIILGLVASFIAITIVGLGIYRVPAIQEHQWVYIYDGLKSESVEVVGIDRYSLTLGLHMKGGNLITVRNNPDFYKETATLFNAPPTLHWRWPFKWPKVSK